MVQLDSANTGYSFQFFNVYSNLVVLSVLVYSLLTRISTASLTKQSSSGSVKYNHLTKTSHIILFI